MIRLDLGTFGAVMQFAMDLESFSKQFYSQLTSTLSNAAIGPSIERAMQRSAARLTTLERIRRENVTEMILEPIKGLVTEDFPYQEKQADSLDSAIALEEIRKGFYEKASEKIEFLIEAADAFERLADENADNMDLFQKHL